ncbi:MAG: LysR family transcriptional regulator, partial [Alphaproteobacteria bacterium]|nr:LysR family transcriptional regulator [Alphaproteobacteria bacterium]
MPRELPPLTAIRAFEAAARNMSMTKAARELGVSPGAVSHQVRQLEEYLGVQLFLRETRKVSLTAAGQACLPALSAGLDNIEEAVRRITVAQRPGRVSVSVEASFAEHWLIPHLESFAKDYPGIVVELLG